VTETALLFASDQSSDLFGSFFASKTWLWIITRSRRWTTCSPLCPSAKSYIDTLTFHLPPSPFTSTHV